VKSRYISTIFK